MKKREITEENTKIVTEEEAYWTEITEALKQEVENTKKKLRYAEFCYNNAKEKLEMVKDE